MKFFTVYVKATGEIVGRTASSTGELPMLQPGQAAVEGFYSQDLFTIVNGKPVPRHTPELTT